MKDKIIGAIYAHVDDAETVMEITKNILAIQKEEAKARYEAAKGDFEKTFECQIMWPYDRFLRIAAGLEPPTK